MNASSSRQASDWDSDTIEGVAHAWWLGLVVGLISIAGGIVLIAWTGPTVTVIALLVGIELLIIGTFVIIAAFGEPPGSRVAGVVGGALAVIAGVIVVRHPSGSVFVVAFAVGIYLILSGVLRLVGAVDASEGRGWLVLAALVDLALGIVLVAWPEFGIKTLAIVLGIVLIVRGLALVLVAFAVRSLAHGQPTKTVPPAGPTVPAT
jgi:uncharacterized membrane protein HdeD (DUF308 family)